MQRTIKEAEVEAEKQKAQLNEKETGPLRAS